MNALVTRRDQRMASRKPAARSHMTARTEGRVAYRGLRCLAGNPCEARKLRAFALATISLQRFAICALTPKGADGIMPACWFSGLTGEERGNTESA